MPIPAITATYAYVADVNTEEVYYTKAATTADTLASISKVATCILTVRKYGGDLSVTTTAITDDLEAGTTAGLLNGDVVSLYDLLHGVLLPSGNDAAYTLARKWGTDVLAEEMDEVTDPIDRFVTEMNALASELSLADTSFVSPSGANPLNVGSATDVYKLFIEALNTSPLETIMGKATYGISVTGGRTTTLNVTTTIDVIEDAVPGVYAGKTGTPGASGVNLVSAWRSPSGTEVVIVVLNSFDDEARYRDTLLIWDQLRFDFPQFDTYRSRWGYSQGVQTPEDGFLRYSPPPANVTFIGRALDETDQTTYSFGDFTFPSDGLAVCAFNARGGTNRSIVSATIGGEAATLHEGARLENLSNIKTIIFSRLVQADDHAVTVTLSGANGSAPVFGHVGVWLLTDMQSIVPYDTDADGTSAASTSTSWFLYVPKDGVAIYAGLQNGPVDMTYTNATQRYEESVASNLRGVIGADMTAAANNDEEAASHLSSNVFPIGASWR
jgi:D-alanyl-D-alanine carboxypeptidase (penicillin-binding protein 5/6)